MELKKSGTDLPELSVQCPHCFAVMKTTRKNVTVHVCATLSQVPALFCAFPIICMHCNDMFHIKVEDAKRLGFTDAILNSYVMHKLMLLGQVGKQLRACIGTVDYNFMWPLIAEAKTESSLQSQPQCAVPEVEELERPLEPVEHSE